MVRCHMWWPSINKEIQQEARNIQACKAIKPGPPTAPCTLGLGLPGPGRVHVDFAGSLPGKMFLLVVVFRMSQTMTIRYYFNHLQGSDSRNSWSKTVDLSCVRLNSEKKNTNGIRHTLCAPHQPALNGSVERFVQTYKTSKKDGHTLNHCLANFLLTYRSTPHTTTGVTPASRFKSVCLPNVERKRQIQEWEECTHLQLVDSQSAFSSWSVTVGKCSTTALTPSMRSSGWIAQVRSRNEGSFLFTKLGHKTPAGTYDFDKR